MYDVLLLRIWSNINISYKIKKACCGIVVSTSASYQGGPVFKSRPRDWLFWQDFSVANSQFRSELFSSLATEPISRPLHFWCTQLLSALKIFKPSHLHSEKLASHSLCYMRWTDTLSELYSCLVIPDKYWRKSAYRLRKWSKGELGQYFHFV
jgi:hypothetical protein